MEKKNTMIDKKSRYQDINEVRKIVLAELKDIPARVFLFGSWARGEEKRTSDIDIAIEIKDYCNEKAITRLRSVLEESYIPYKVDIVNLNETEKRIYDKVMKEGILWKG